MHEGSAAQQNPITSSQGTKPISLPTSMAGMMALSGFCRRDRPKIDQLSGTVPLIALALEDHQACMRVYMCMCICIEREGSGRPPASGSVRTLHLPAVHLPLVLSRPSPAASPVAHTCTCTRAQPSISRCIAARRAGGTYAPALLARGTAAGLLPSNTPSAAFTPPSALTPPSAAGTLARGMEQGAEGVEGVEGVERVVGATAGCVTEAGAGVTAESAAGSAGGAVAVAAAVVATGMDRRVRISRGRAGGASTWVRFSSGSGSG